MFVKNCWDLKLPFTVANTVIPYDNKWHELRDGACEPNGVRGYLICARTNPNPPPPIPQIIEIDLRPLYQRILSPEDQIKCEKVMEESRKASIELARKNRELKEKANEQSKRNSIQNTQGNSETTTNSESPNTFNISNSQQTQITNTQEITSTTTSASDNSNSPVNPLDQPYRISKNPKPKVDKPLKGFKLKPSVRRKYKEKELARKVSEGKRDYSIQAKDKIDGKLGLNVSDEFKNSVDAKLGL